MSFVLLKALRIKERQYGRAWHMCSLSLTHVPSLFSESSHRLLYGTLGTKILITQVRRSPITRTASGQCLNTLAVQ